MQLPFNKIRSKYQFYSLSLVLLAAGLGLLFYVYTLRIDEYHTYQSQLNKLPLIYAKIHQSTQRFQSEESNTMRFLSTGESKYLDEYEQNFRRFEKALEALLPSAVSGMLQKSENLKQLDRHLKQHRKYLYELVNKTKQLGKDDTGLEGGIKKELIRLKSSDIITAAQMLTLQKYKNDFLIYKNPESIKNLKTETHSILDEISLRINLEDSTGRAKMAYAVHSIEKYKHSIDRLLAAHQEIGLNMQEGLQAKINKEHQYIDHQLTLQQENAEASIALLIKKSKSFIWTIFLITLMITILLSLIISKIESNAIVGLDRITKSLRMGIRNQEKLLNHNIFKRNDEIGSIARNFQYFIAKFKKALGQITEKNLKLEEVAQQEKLRKWHTEGMNLMKDIFRKNYQNPEQQSFEIISELAKYTHSQQGGLFVMHPEIKEKLELKACYAYERQKYRKKTIEMGEGLVGTAWKENKTLLITDIIPNYAYITSSLGKTAPNSLLLIPLRVEDKVVGVIELMSLKPYQKHEIEFIENAATRIANAVIATQANEQNQTLLKNTEQLAKEAQEKEMKLQEQIKNYQYWLKEFENKLKQSTDSQEVYQSILHKMYKGMIVTNEKFRIIMVNNFILKRFNHQEETLLNQPLENLLDTDYENILDLRESKLKLNTPTFDKNLKSRIIDQKGKTIAVESISGKLEIEDKVVYVFLINEQKTDSAAQQNNGNSQLKVAS